MPAVERVLHRQEAGVTPPHWRVMRSTFESAWAISVRSWHIGNSALLHGLIGRAQSVGTGGYGGIGSSTRSWKGMRASGPVCNMWR